MSNLPNPTRPSWNPAERVLRAASPSGCGPRPGVTGAPPAVGLPWQLAQLAPAFMSCTYGAGCSTQEGTLATILEIHREGQAAAPHLRAARGAIVNVVDIHAERPLAGFLAYAVGFGGSMIWFGSSAGVAITNKFPEGRNVIAWVKQGWHVSVAYVIGFFILFLTMGWEPADNKEHKVVNCPVPGCPMAGQGDSLKESGATGGIVSHLHTGDKF